MRLRFNFYDSAQRFKRINNFALLLKWPKSLAVEQSCRKVFPCLRLNSRPTRKYEVLQPWIYWVYASTSKHQMSSCESVCDGRANLMWLAAASSNFFQNTWFSQVMHDAPNAAAFRPALEHCGWQGCSLQWSLWCIVHWENRCISM